jgi:hypothetical protein
VGPVLLGAAGQQKKIAKKEASFLDTAFVKKGDPNITGHASL